MSVAALRTPALHRSWRPRVGVDRPAGVADGVDILINDAGSFDARTGGFESVSDEDWRATFELKLFAPVRLIRVALPSLTERKGAVVNVSSGRSGKALAEQLGPRGVRVSIVSPGPTRTPAWDLPDGLRTTLAAAAGSTLDESSRTFPPTPA